ncbi:hypothetical protein BD626DRAFT_400640 [Schizophyllum amplum]|uniref:C2H2-type domain-containing protein n=1 Tax=Schizophyllum amplum TaxID=97359 RepID=A0A550CHJ8_9AGAR|nr:hypothetical protein BD626DRAFT_400640 [Auriculariopsis ampla]
MQKRPGHIRQSRSEDYSSMQHLPPGVGSGVGTTPAFLTPDMEFRTGRSSGWGLGASHTNSQARSLSPAGRTSSPYVPEHQRSYTPDARFQPMGPPSARSLSPAGSLYGHHRRASSERGSATWNPQPPGLGIGMGGRGRPSPYPSPNASPRWPTSDLDGVDAMMGMGGGDMHLVSEMGLAGLGGGMMHGMGGMGMGGSGPQSAVCDASGSDYVSVAKPNVTTGRTANASHRRRKQEATFKCPVPGCGSTFTRSFNLKGHIRSHNEEKPFRCHWPGCGKGFARQHDCKRHEQLHTNYRPFQCDGCRKQFARMDALNRHLKSEGGVECARILEMKGKMPASSASPDNPSDGIGGGGGGGDGPPTLAGLGGDVKPNLDLGIGVSMLKPEPEPDLADGVLWGTAGVPL